MELINFDKYPQNLKVYGGMDGRKVGITVNGQDYLIKYPQNLKNAGMKNIAVSYSNSPLCEYIGSHVYELVGIDAHKTYLGKRGGKTVVACEDFLGDDERLYEFGDIKVTSELNITDSLGNETDGTGKDLHEILTTIREHPILRDVPGVEDRFWDMFVVDALIGNPDRNNGNWGIIVNRSGEKRLSPVYDNGNCLACKWDDAKMAAVLLADKTIDIEAFKGRRCIFELNGKRVNPYTLMQSMQYGGLTNSVMRLAPEIEFALPKIGLLIEDSPASGVQKEFYRTMINRRFEAVIKPVCQKAAEQDRFRNPDDFER